MFNLRKGSHVVALGALIAEHNARRDSEVGANFHSATTSGVTNTNDPENPVPGAAAQVTAADSSDLPTAIVLVNQERVILNQHFADEVSHDTAVSAAVTDPDAFDQTSAEVLANAIKAAYNTHRTEANVHFNPDAANVVAAADASDLATLQTLVDEIKADLNAHITGALAGNGITQINA